MVFALNWYFPLLTLDASKKFIASIGLQSAKLSQKLSDSSKMPFEEQNLNSSQERTFFFQMDPISRAYGCFLFLSELTVSPTLSI